MTEYIDPMAETIAIQAQMDAREKLKGDPKVQPSEKDSKIIAKEKTTRYKWNRN